MLGRQQEVGSMQRGSLHKAPAWLSRLLQHPLHLLDFYGRTSTSLPLNCTLESTSSTSSLRGK